MGGKWKTTVSQLRWANTVEDKLSYINLTDHPNLRKMPFQVLMNAQYTHIFSKETCKGVHFYYTVILVSDTEDKNQHNTSSSF